MLLQHKAEVFTWIEKRVKGAESDEEEGDEGNA